MDGTPAVIMSGDELTIVKDGESHTIMTNHPRYDDIKEAVREKSWDSLDDMLRIDTVVESFSGGVVTIENGIVLYKGEAVHNTLTNHMLDMIKEGFDVEPMRAFLENLMQNPSKRACEELYSFLEHGRLPITDDGHFLAYKKVREDFTDIHSGKYDNSPGETPEMDRNKVEDNRDITCASGLHFCSLEYLPKFSSSHNNRIVIVKVNPADVVSIPSDYNNTKGRACKYYVVEEYVGDPTKDAFKRSVQNDLSDVIDDIKDSDDGSIYEPLDENSHNHLSSGTTREGKMNFSEAAEFLGLLESDILAKADDPNDHEVRHDYNETRGWVFVSFDHEDLAPWQEDMLHEIGMSFLLDDDYDDGDEIGDRSHSHSSDFSRVCEMKVSEAAEFFGLLESHILARAHDSNYPEIEFDSENDGDRLVFVSFNPDEIDPTQAAMIHDMGMSHLLDEDDVEIGDEKDPTKMEYTRTMRLWEAARFLDLPDEGDVAVRANDWNDDSVEWSIDDDGAESLEKVDVVFTFEKLSEKQREFLDERDHMNSTISGPEQNEVDSRTFISYDMDEEDAMVFFDLNNGEEDTNQFYDMLDDDDNTTLEYGPGTTVHVVVRKSELTDRQKRLLREWNLDVQDNFVEYDDHHVSSYEFSDGEAMEFLDVDHQELCRLIEDVTVENVNDSGHFVMIDVKESEMTDRQRKLLMEWFLLEETPEEYSERIAKEKHDLLAEDAKRRYGVERASI